MNIDEAATACDSVLETVAQAIVSERSFLETVLLGLLAQGHVLLEDVPGTGKTLTARSFARGLGLSFSRVQFTPDLLPADVTGSHVFNEQHREFEFREGPIFSNVVLADEINRAPPKTQSALLEAMAEQQVTVGGETRSLPEPFFVIATQNPIEHEGTFVLPEAQIDRFMVKTSIGYPNYEGERTLLERRAARQSQTPSIDTALSPDQVTALQQTVETVRVDPDLIEYMLELTRATRTDRRVAVGVSPRGSQRLFEATRARAIIDGRTYATPDTVTEIVDPVLTHRLVLTPDARVNDVDKATIIEDIVAKTPVPTIDSKES